ncbi:hypothetical protein V8E52_002478 [Russula decolorans]|jgi:hypothetical protein
MPFILPAARAHHHADRHRPALDVHFGRAPHTISSPGAGSRNPHLYYNNELDNDHDGPPVLTASTPVPAAVAASAQTPSIGDIPTASPVVGGSTSMATQSIPGVLPLSDPVPSSMLSASSNIILSQSSSSPSPTSTSTPTTTAVASSAVLQSPEDTMPVRGGMTSSVPAESALAGNTNNSSSHRPSGGAIAAIVIVLLLASCAVAFFVFRRYRIQKRVARRVTWTTNLAPQPLDASLEKGVDHDPAVSSDAGIVTASQLSKEGGNGPEKPLPLVRNIARKPPLPYSPVSPIAPSPSQSSHISIPDARAASMDSASISTVPSTPVPEVPVLVRMTFVAQLPDELAITPGETIHIRTEFDDGWALCANRSGKQGMVPLECLEGGGGQFAGHSPLRNMRRASSLNSAVTWS